MQRNSRTWPNPLGATVIHSVDDGYSVEHNGEKLRVSKGSSVQRNNIIFMEHGDYEKLKKDKRVKNWVNISRW